MVNGIGCSHPENIREYRSNLAFTAGSINNRSTFLRKTGIQRYTKTAQSRLGYQAGNGHKAIYINYPIA